MTADISNAAGDTEGNRSSIQLRSDLRADAILVDPAETTNGKMVTDATASVAENGVDHEESDDDKDDQEEGVAAGTGAGIDSSSTNSVQYPLIITAAKKKKKRKPKKKKNAASKSQTQTSPPRVPVSKLFPDNQYPTGQEVEYKDDNSYRTTSEEKRHLDRMNQDFLTDYRQAAEVHRQVRQWAQKNIKPGQTLTEIAEGIEDGVRYLTDHQGLEEGDNIKGGMGFPTGVNLNNIAAHYSPNAGNKIVLGQEDVMKVDIGVHINGRIVDSAFTMAFNPVYDNLLNAVKDATNAGVRVCYSFSLT